MTEKHHRLESTLDVVCFESDGKNLIIHLSPPVNLRLKCATISDMNGYLHVYTGGGKGKSTAAFGLALRARGANLKVKIIQFIKNKSYSEIGILSQIGVSVEQFGCGLMLDRSVTTQDRDRANEGLNRIDRLFSDADFNLLILDEINVALSRDLVDESYFHRILDKRPEAMEVICTGRGAPNSLIQRADLVTEMKPVKHYYQSGVPARIGIEM